MRKFLSRPWFIVVAALLAIGAGYGVSLIVREGSAPGAGETEVSLTDLNGTPQRIEAVQAPLRLVNFWATWCPPCREEIPLLVQIQNHYRAQGLRIIGIAVDQPAAVAAFSDMMGINYLNWLATDPFALMKRYGNNDGALPYSVLLAPDGTILHRKLGPYAPAELTQMLEGAFAAAATRPTR